ncbi:hypothetical protein HZH68_011526 [Vespula germanica]|uniref:Uncharacterized protein n=1 Tax=Vespula germanica TaxID=30212 RepID=A0A834N2M9_VESGE|nr:hypothetical protein HZH68_011526 [Vespula germanica]
MQANIAGIPLCIAIRGVSEKMGEEGSLQQSLFASSQTLQFYIEPFSRSENIESISVRIEVPSFIESKDWDKAIVILLTWQKRRHVGYQMDFGVDSSSFIGLMACGVRGNWEKYIKSFSRLAAGNEEIAAFTYIRNVFPCFHGNIASKRVHQISLKLNS